MGQVQERTREREMVSSSKAKENIKGNFAMVGTHGC